MGILNLNEYADSFDLTAKRDIETQGKNYLINHLLGREATIDYDEKGKPFLTNERKHISISHSHDKLSIIVNEKEATGIDIELIRDKVLKIEWNQWTDNQICKYSSNS